MPQPAQVEAAAARIIALYQASQERLEAELARILTDPAQTRRRARIRELLAVLDGILADTDASTQAWLARDLPAVYATGSRDMVDPHTWTLPHRRAVNVIAQDTGQSILAATRFMRRDAKRWIRDTARLLTATGIIEGRTPDQLAREFRRLAPTEFFHRHRVRPISAVRYRDGSYRTLDDYADMLFRTTTARAYNTGGLQQALQGSVRFVEVADGPGCKLDSHGDPGPDDINGRILDVRTAFDHVIAHPRCVRAFLPRPDATGTDADSLLAARSGEPSGPFVAGRSTGRQPRAPRTPRR